jgi:hypothetical protein
LSFEQETNKNAANSVALNLDILITLHATNAKQVALGAGAPLCMLVVVSHAPAVSGEIVGLSTGTPPVAEETGIAEFAIGIAVAAREGCKAVRVQAVAVVKPTALCFKLLARKI